MIFDALQETIQHLVSKFDTISSERKKRLLVLAEYLQEKYNAKATPKLIVICTHNSRRSHIGQLWLAVAAEYYQLPMIETFSGGTEATAFHPNAIKAMQGLGFTITVAEDRNPNPIYDIQWAANQNTYQAFSKRYEDTPNPTENFGAIMVCSEADQGCPLVLGADFRLALPFNDPKAFDGTALQDEKYTERALQIGTEILYVFNCIKTVL